MRKLVLVPPGLKFENRDKVRRVNQPFVFRPLFAVQAAFIGTLTERVDTGLPGASIRNATRRRAESALRQRLSGSRRLSSPAAVLTTSR